LPPGNYRLDAYGVSDSVADIIDLRVHPAPRFTVQSIDTALDLGMLDLTLDHDITIVCESPDFPLG
jgi:hypothetical protein